MSSIFNNIDYKAFLIKSGTSSQPLNVVYYSQPRNLITAISQALAAVITITDAIDFVKYPVGSTFNVYINGVLQTAGTGSNVDGAYIATVVSSTTFSVPEDTLTGTPSTFDVSNGYVYFEDCIVKNVTIDSYDSSGSPVLFGTVLANHRYNIVEGRFEYTSTDDINKQISINSLTSNLDNLHILNDDFTKVTQSGHTTMLNATSSDLNDSNNIHWIMPGTATTLSIVSTSAQDGVAGTGLTAIGIDGLDQNLDPILDTIFMNGTTPVISTLSFRAMNLSFAIFGGTPGSGAVGTITISATSDSQIFGKYLPNDTSCEVGRYTVRRGYRLLGYNLYISGGKNVDATLVLQIKRPGFADFSVGQIYPTGSDSELRNVAAFFLEEGQTTRLKAFYNSGGSGVRYLSAIIIGQLASVSTWDKIKVPIIW